MLINDGSKGSIVVDVTVVIAGITVGTIRTPVHFLLSTTKNKKTRKVFIMSLNLNFS